MYCFLFHSVLFGITLFSAYDPQSSLTISMGWPKPDELETTLSTLMGKILETGQSSPEKEFSITQRVWT